MKLLILTANVLGWPFIQLSLARLFLLRPDKYFAHDSWLTRQRRFEREGRLYRGALGVQRWKGMLPDGAPWLGGRSKSRIVNRNSADLQTFLVETRRAETAHWCMLLCTPIFYLWNPGWACIAMTCYGIAANLPCVVVQRVNRAKAAQILRRLPIQV